jgi:hypothetical protein
MVVEEQERTGACDNNSNNLKSKSLEGTPLPDTKKQTVG